MRKIILFLPCFFLISSFCFSENKAYTLNINDAIGPITYYQITRVINSAEKNNAEFVLLIIDTPGGLLSSTRKIVQEILKSKVPIIGFVYPSGAQCASAGTFIALSCDILVMAPATNIGAAHPVTLTGGDEQNKTMEEKVVNDTVSFIKSIAKYKGRNEKWAEKAVRESISSTETEALKNNVIDFIAEDIDQLLKKLDGKKIKKNEKEIILHTKDIVFESLKQSFKDDFLKTISDPNIAYLLLIIGMWGIILEFSHPGFGLPGIAGTICLILGFFALHTMPINIAGLLLLILGFILFGIEAITPTFGLFFISGIISFLIGSFMLIRPGSEIKIATSLIFTVAFASGFFIWAILLFALKTRRRKVTTGTEGLIGEKGRVKTDLNPEGLIFVHGEYWKGIPKDKNEIIKKNEEIKVIGKDGPVLIVEKINKEGDR
ncbi:MAG TPA: nodulation protein NfeD [bacterium]|nr:nodulation protein NfeD [bacterium]